MPDWIEPVRRRLLKSRRPVKANLIVAQDGSGKYKTINEALKDIPLKSKKTVVLYIKRGIYKENVIFPKKMDHLVVIGDGPTKTIISGRRNFIDGIQTFATATVCEYSSILFRDLFVMHTSSPDD
ncbi:hypothetical protein MLD38_015601 [Melastoma candidum]|uniref:Uncharacterized protein n=1 Tax=Melastoma candidum TaxID=119954 RepID=A0ACB9RKU0_9MYRT|nr:hypothetical protein MLD38_015601 [Melastoma candidum]